MAKLLLLLLTVGRSSKVCVCYKHWIPLMFLRLLQFQMSTHTNTQTIYLIIINSIYLMYVWRLSSVWVNLIWNKSSSFAFAAKFWIIFQSKSSFVSPFHATTPPNPPSGYVQIEFYMILYHLSFFNIFSTHLYTYRVSSSYKNIMKCMIWITK